MATEPRRDDLTAEQRRRIEALFHEIADLPESERADRLDARVPSGDPVHTEVDALLRLLDEASDSGAETATTAPDGRVGERLGRYSLTHLIGKGGMGVVYAARDETLGREIAVKILPPELSARPEVRKRFAREARAVAALNHPNIVTIHSVEETSGEHFLTMERLDGRRLSESIPHHGLPLGELFDLAIPLVSAVSAAHEEGIIHRDLKPDNVVVTEKGQVKVLDFGLAKLKAGVQSEDGGLTGATMATAEGKIMGTAAYMSPEQAEGKPVDARADLFSLGIVLYEMATGQRPFEGDSSISVISSILKDTPPPITDVNPRLPYHLGRIVKRCLAKDPARRYQTALDLENELEALREEIDSAVLEAPAAAAAGGRSSTNRILVLAFATATIVALAAIGWLVFGGDRADPPRPALQARLTQLTDQPGFELEPAISPDGKEFAYVADSEGNLDICVQKVGSGVATNLTEACPEDDVNPAYSPDGKHIAFHSGRDGGGIYVMDATGENLRLVTRVGHHPSWSPDGKRLAVATERTDWPSRFLGPCAIRVVEIESGQSREICGENSMQPSWSPHGHRIAYWTFEGGRAIWTVPAGGGESVRAVGETKTRIGYVWNPVWSPDGKHLYFCSDWGGMMGIFRIAIDERSGRRLGPVEAVTTSHTHVAMPSISRDGRKIVHYSHTVSPEITRFAFDPDRGVVVGGGAVVCSGMSVSEIDVAPAGNWLVGASFHPREDIFVMRTDGTDRCRLTNDEFMDRSPRWSPDGSEIAFYSPRGKGFQIHTIRREGGQCRERTDVAESVLAHPVWSPDPKAPRLAAYRSGRPVRDDKSTVVYGSTSGAKFGDRSVLPPWPGAGEHFVVWSWSPDGSKLAGHVARSGRGTDPVAVAVYSFATRSYEVFTADGGFPRWLPDSRRLLFIGDERLHLVDTATKEVRKLAFPERAHPPKAGRLALTRDGKTLYTLSWGGRSDIWLLELR